MQHVSGNAVGATDSELKLRKPRSASKAVRAVERGKPVSTAKAAPAGGKTVTAAKGAASAPTKKSTVKKTATPTKKPAASTHKRAAAIKKVTPQKRQQIVTPKLEASVGHATAQQFSNSAHDIGSGVAARVEEARKGFPEDPKRFSLARIRELFRKIFGF